MIDRDWNNFINRNIKLKFYFEVNGKLLKFLVEGMI